MYKDNSLNVEFDTKFDFIFLDGDHTYNNVRAELIKYSKYLKQGGTLAGHDYGCPPCTKAITEFATNNDLAVWTMQDSVWHYKPYRTRQQVV
jgi:cephalosporin hydroxylase